MRVSSDIYDDKVLIFQTLISTECLSFPPPIYILSMDVMKDKDIRMNETTNRFELFYNDDIAYIDYRWYNKTLILVYIFVPVQFRGKGLSTKLIEFALQYAREKEVKIKVFCPYISKYIRMHPEHQDLLEQ